ncbi:MAG: AAA family ATPase [Candidatus Omnitrophica bacterium]|nr:AAA family ATPase [Candidatus Omnitrophota bacterium]
MYDKYYGLDEKPFNLTPDSRYFFHSLKHEEALNRLLLAISERNGFAVITGEIGSGKTTVLRTLLSKLNRETKVALVMNTYLSKKELLTTILEDLGVEYTSLSKTHLLRALNDYLVAQAALGVNVVLMIDEAQNLAPTVLEEVRMLSNMETEEEKLIQIILVGQPELRKKLLRPGLEQFSQRVVFYYHLGSLDYDETKRYISHRLERSGRKGDDLFSEEAIEEIYAYSNGIPRLINIVCHNSLITGLVRDADSITGSIVRETTGELIHNRNSMHAEKIC